MKFLTKRARHATEESFIAEGNKQANKRTTRTWGTEHGKPGLSVAETKKKTGNTKAWNGAPVQIGSGAHRAGVHSCSLP